MQVASAVLQVPAVQCVSAVHSTQVPENAELVLPQTFLPATPSAEQLVPVAAGVKAFASGMLVQAGLTRHAVVDVGRSVGSWTDLVPPLPSQTTFWQLPGVWQLPGTVPLVSPTPMVSGPPLAASAPLSPGPS